MRTIESIMTREVETIGPNSSLYEAACLMRQLNVGALPVCDGDRLMGLLTDRDIVVRAIAGDRDPLETTAQEVMSADIVCCQSDESVDEAARIMADHQIRRLPIVDGDQRLVGIVSLGDLAVDAGDSQAVGETTRAVSEPAEPRR